MIHGLDSRQYQQGFWSHPGKNLGHDSWTRIESKLHGFWGDGKGGILARFLANDWQDFDVIFGVNFGVNFEKEIAYLFRHPRVRAHV